MNAFISLQSQTVLMLSDFHCHIAAMNYVLILQSSKLT